MYLFAYIRVIESEEHLLAKYFACPLSMILSRRNPKLGSPQVADRHTSLSVWAWLLFARHCGEPVLGLFFCRASNNAMITSRPIRPTTTSENPTNAAVEDASNCAPKSKFTQLQILHLWAKE